MHRFLFVFALATCTAFGQETSKECGHNQALERLFQRSPKFKLLHQQTQDQLDEDRAKYLAEKNEIREGTVYTIPVVFHILHNDGPEKISIAQCKSAIDKMNRDFSASNSDVNDVVDAFKGKQANCEIQFRLATKAPDGTCFPGVTYTKSSKTEGDVAWGDGHDQVSDIMKGNNVFQGDWELTTNYMHVYVCKSLEDGAPAYTFYPNEEGMYLQIFVTPARVGTIEAASNVVGGTTMSHEVGHWLNLAHPWGNSNDAEASDNCNIDDGVEDTPLCKGIRSCNLKNNSCNGDNAYWGFDQIDNVENFMDYSGCRKMFTEGQKDRMRAALNSSVAGRNNLWTEANLQKVGAVDDPALCAAYFESNRTTICEGQSIEFTDQSFNGKVVKWNWSFEGGTPAISNEQNPTITYNSAGQFKVTLTVEDAAGNKYNKTQSNYVTVNEGAGSITSITEGFETLSSLSGSQWKTTSGNDFEWEVYSNAAASGNKCIRIVSRSGSGWDEKWNAIDKDILQSPMIDLSGQNNVVLSFKYAHVKFVDSLRDKLRIKISKDCGKSWSTKKQLSSKLLTGDNHSISFVPEAKEWNSTSIKVSDNFHVSNFMFRLEYESFGGNNVYIDDINLSASNDVAVEEITNTWQPELFPNPAKDVITLSFKYLPSRDLKINLSDVQGRQIKSFLYPSFNEKTLSLPVHQFDRGLYIVEVISGQKKYRSKVLLE